jgi:hypothetical protein
MAGFAVTLEEPANIPGQNSGCGKSEQFLDAAFHREVLKCFTVTRQKATTVAQTVAETSAPDPTRWRFSKPPPNRILLTDAKTLEFSAFQLTSVGSEKSGIPHSGNSGTPSGSRKS